MKRQTIDIICRALLAIVAALRKEYGLPDYKNITIDISDRDSIAGITNDGIMPKTE